MLSKKQIIQNQQKFNMDDLNTNIEQSDLIDYRDYKKRCREYLISKTKEMSSDYYSKSLVEKQAIDSEFITDFVHAQTAPVKGYFENGARLINPLVHDLVKDLTLYDVLTPLLNDESIGEIQINDLNSIFYEVQKDGIGAFERYKDEKGKPLGFSSEEEMLTILNKLIADQSADTRITSSNALINARTPQGYRIAIVDKDPFSPAPPPHDHKSYSCVIRKIKQTRLTMKDLVGFRSLSMGMAGFLKLIAEAENKIFCVGSTGSGKTVTLDIMLRGVNMRTLLIQNPTEIDNRVRDDSGTVLNNTVLWEAKDDPKTEQVRDSYPTLQNLNSHALRFTPELILVGEVRKPGEFSELLRVMMTGHLAWSSFHADTCEEAVKRFAQEVASATKMDIEMATDQVCDALNFIIVQKKLKDGTRKITSISEIIRYDSVNKKPVINEIYRFKPDGTKTIKQDKVVLKVGGKHEKCGKISDKMIDKLYMAGITNDEIKEYISDDYSKEETYEWYDI